jgi:A nuclease family of the HNH/ENDO VII superfamily with conserved AHH
MIAVPLLLSRGVRRCRGRPDDLHAGHQPAQPASPPVQGRSADRGRRRTTRRRRSGPGQRRHATGAHHRRPGPRGLGRRHHHREFRHEIAATAPGRDFLAAWDIVSTLITAYGVARLATQVPAALRRLRSAFERFRGTSPSLPADTARRIESEVDDVLHQADEAEQATASAGHTGQTSSGAGEAVDSRLLDTGQAARSVAPSSRALGRALEAAGHVRPPGSAAHHIVAGDAEAAAPARAVLARFGIGMNDAANGVFLPKNLSVPNPTGAAVHSTVHTRAYYQAVNRRLSQAATRQEVLEALESIRQGLLSGGI